jgi:Ca2+-binding RTX toxin-like protein
VMETADPEGEGFASPDTVDGGPGNDVISSRWGPSTVDAGDGNDYVQVSDTAFGGNGTADGSRVEMGAGDDQVVARYVRRLNVDGGVGDDEIAHSLYDGSGRTVTDGGAGNDHLQIATASDVARGSRITVDRRKSRIAARRTMATMRGYEHHKFSGAGMTWVYVGTNAKDDVDAERVGNLRATTYGGRDRVQASRGRDHLDLGRGVDRADGSKRRDTCISVERANSCEVRR